MASVKEHFEGLIQEATAIILDGELSHDLFDKASANIEEVMTVDRENHGLAFLMGSLYMRAGRHALAEHWLRRSIDMEPSFDEAWNNLGFVCEQEGRRKESIRCFQRADELNPNSAPILNNLATAYVNNGSPDRCIEFCKRALAIEPDALDPKWNMGLALLEKGEWRKGWAYYETGLDLADSPQSTMHRKTREYMGPDGKLVDYWDGTDNKTVVIYGEQGVGDEIMAYSMIPDAMKHANVILETHPRLVNLARNAFGTAMPIYGTRKVPQEHLTYPRWHRIEAKLPILSLGKFFRNDASEFPKTPYMKPFDHCLEYWTREFADMSSKPKVGISWKGGSIVTRNDLRSIPLERWQPLLEAFPGVDWVSLQYDPPDQVGLNAAVVENFNKATGLNLYHWQDPINDLDNCYGGMIHALDLVISINTSLVHACGAMGVECWTLTPNRPAWRYGLSGDEMPWYGPHVRQLRQEVDDWGPVLKRVMAELSVFLDKRAAA